MTYQESSDYGGLLMKFYKDSKEFTGNFCIDDLVLHESGVKDFKTMPT